MTLRIDIEHLAEEIDGALARVEAGDEVLLERHGIDVIFSLLEVPAALAFNRP